MHLLLTRAPADAARTRAKLEMMGHTVLVAPVLEIVPLPVCWPPGVIDAVVASSGHAFETVAKSALPTEVVRRLMPLFLVGHRTVLQARKAGFLGPTAIAASAATLSIGDGETRLKRVVYLAGQNRKPDIESILSAAAETIELVESYEARALDAYSDPVLAALQSRAIDGILHFSQRSSARFLALASRALAPQTQHFCLSADVAKPLRNAGCQSIKVAEAPDEPALLALLDRDAGQA